MSKLYISVGAKWIEVLSPDASLDPVAHVFPDSQRTRPPSNPVGTLHVRQIADNQWVLSHDGMPDTAPQAHGEVFRAIEDRLWAIRKIHCDTGDVFLRASAVSWGETAILIVGPENSGRSFLTAWMVEKGFALISDQIVLLSHEHELRVAGLTGPVDVAEAAAGQLARLPSFQNRTAIKVADRRLFAPDPTWVPLGGGVAPALILFVGYGSQSPDTIGGMSVDNAYEALLSHAGDESGQQSATLRSLADETPCVRLQYQSFEELDDLLDQLALYAAETRPSPDVFGRFVSRIHARPAAPATYEIPAETDRNLSAKLSIGMATYDDYDGVYFSIQSIRLHHPEILDQVEFIVVDNHPDGACADALKQLENSIPNYRYIPEKKINGTAVRDLVFEKAVGDFVLCMDCHVLFEPGALAKLITYIDANPQTDDLLQGPLIRDDLNYTTVYTHFEPIWSAGMYGRFACSDPTPKADDPAFDIPMQGLGVFACRRESWPGFNRNFRGFGGEEGYIHQKYRNLGRRTLCLPSFRWLHRFGRPLGIPYVISWEDRIRNYWLGWTEVGLPLAPMQDHFAEQLSKEKVDEVITNIRSQNT